MMTRITILVILIWILLITIAGVVAIEVVPRYWPEEETAPATGNQDSIESPTLESQPPPPFQRPTCYRILRTPSGNFVPEIWEGRDDGICYGEDSPSEKEAAEKAKRKDKL